MAKLLLGLFVQFFIVDSRICLKYRIKVSEITKEVILCEYSRQPLAEEKNVLMKIKSGRCMKFLDSVNKTLNNLKILYVGPESPAKII